MRASNQNQNFLYEKTSQSFHLGSKIWADFPKQSYLTTIIHFFMLYRPVKSEGQKGHFWPSYEAAKLGQVRFCNATCDSFHLMVRKCVLFFPVERFCKNALFVQKGYKIV